MALNTLMLVGAAGAPAAEPPQAAGAQSPRSADLADPFQGGPAHRGGGRNPQAGVRPVLHALGDSTAAGVGARSGSYVDRLAARLAQSGRAFRVANLSESGATASDVLHDQVTRVTPGEAGLVVLGVGVNDLTRNVSPDQFGEQFQAIITGIRARTSAPIVVSNLPDVSLAPAVWSDLRPALAARVDRYNAVIARLARKNGLAVFDTCAMTRQQLPAHPEYLSADGFHPSDQGYQVWADGLWQVVQRVL